MMKLLAIVICSATVAACSSDVIPLSNIEIEGTSEQADSEYIYFTSSAGNSCGGIRIEEDGAQRRITFVREGAPVDAETVLSNDYAWEGFLRVEVPLSETILTDGGSMTLISADSWSENEIGTYSYPPRKLSDEQEQSDRRSADG